MKEFNKEVENELARLKVLQNEIKFVHLRMRSFLGKDTKWVLKFEVCGDDLTIHYIDGDDKYRFVCKSLKEYVLFGHGIKIY